MLEAAGEVQGRAGRGGGGGWGGSRGERTHPVRVVGLKDQADTGPLCRGSSNSPADSECFLAFLCFIHKSQPDPAHFLNNKSDS